MAIDFEGIINKMADGDGNIPAANVAKIAAALSSAVGREFVPKDRYNARLEEIETLKTEKAAAEDQAAAGGRWEKKHAELKREFDAFKAEQATKEQRANVRAAYRKLLEEAGIDARRIDVILRATVFDGMKLDAEGHLEGADALRKAIDHDWSDFKVVTRTEGAKVDNPPRADSGGANPRAAEIARKFHEQRYGKAPDSGADKT